MKLRSSTKFPFNCSLFQFEKFVCLFHLFTLYFSPKVPGKFRPKLNKTGKQQQEERCFSWIACESLKLTTHSSYSAHQKELKFRMEGQTFPFLFYSPSSSAALFDQHWRKHFTNTVVILFLKCELNTIHLYAVSCLTDFPI